MPVKNTTNKKRKRNESEETSGKIQLKMKKDEKEDVEELVKIDWDRRKKLIELPFDATKLMEAACSILINLSLQQFRKDQTSPPPGFLFVATNSIIQAIQRTPWAHLDVPADGEEILPEDRIIFISFEYLERKSPHHIPLTPKQISFRIVLLNAFRTQYQEKVNEIFEASDEIPLKVIFSKSFFKYE